jgi:hypothetical protein
VIPAHLFVSSTVHERTVEIGGEPHTFWFREITTAQARRFAQAERSDDPDMHARAVPILLAAAMCNPDGSPAISEEDAARLKPAVAGALSAVAVDVAGLAPTGGALGNGSPPETSAGSGTS